MFGDEAFADAPFADLAGRAIFTGRLIFGALECEPAVLGHLSIEPAVHGAVQIAPTVSAKLGEPAP